METEISSFKLNYRIVNRSSQEMVVRAKGGLGYIIRRAKEPSYSSQRQVHVHIPQIVIANLLIDESAALTLFDKQLLKGIRLDRDRLKDSEGNFADMFSQDINVVIALTSSLVEKNDAIHSEILGITLYNGMENATQPSMNTPTFTLKELCTTTLGDQPLPKGGLHHFVYVNDPRRESNPMYTNVMGKAVEVPVVYDDSKQPGLYTGVMYGNESPQILYYTFEGLDAKILESLGLFSTKSACENGGNTERMLTAENKVKEFSKEVGRLKDHSNGLQDLLSKSEIVNSRLAKDLTQSRQDHKTEVAQVKHEHRLEMSQLKHHTKVSGDIFKYESRIKDTVNKASMELVKQKGSANNWGEFAKAVGAIAGVAFTGYKLFTS
jgi:hypothetical protein